MIASRYNFGMTAKKYSGHRTQANQDDDEWEDDGVKSKSELKREMHALQDLAKEVAELSRDQLKRVPLDETLRDAFESTRSVRSHEGMRRHIQYLGRLMRRYEDTDIAAIRLQLESFKGLNKAETAKLHRIERLREKLLAKDEALTELIQSHPQVDAQALRTLIRNARRETEQKKPPKAFREIYQILKELLETGPVVNSVDPDAYHPEDEA